MGDLKWDLRYIELAKHISTWSKDPSTQVGAVAIGDYGQVLSTGYNGFPRGVDDTDDRLTDRETKYSLTSHAEMNVIYGASLNGVSLKGSTLYIWGLPLCSDCAKGVIQVGIKRVVMPKQVPDKPWPDKWRQSFQLTSKILTEAGVKYDWV
jgi:dCMP deaminase